MNPLAKKLIKNLVTARRTDLFKCAVKVRFSRMYASDDFSDIFGGKLLVLRAMTRNFIKIMSSVIFPDMETDSLFIILLLFPRKIFFSISKKFVLLFNNHPSLFGKLIKIAFPALVLTILVLG